VEVDSFSMELDEFLLNPLHRDLIGSSEMHFSDSMHFLQFQSLLEDLLWHSMVFQDPILRQLFNSSSFSTSKQLGCI
jgi:hypothetical protein